MTQRGRTGSPAQHDVLVDRYTPGFRTEWDAFVHASRNGTFLFDRAYMDYHADRFTDHSLMVRDGGGNVVALLPAERDGDRVRSHGGLTYGGFVTDERMTALLMGRVFAAVSDALQSAGVRQLVYKTVPRIYHSSPSDEDAYWLFRNGARLFRRDLLSVMEYAQRGPIQERRTRVLRKASREGLELRESQDYGAFWAVLDANLRSRHGVGPVHSLSEITLLASRFPDAIRLVTACAGDRVLAGAVAYVSRHVCHIQYNASSDVGRRKGALDLILEHLITTYAGRVRFFDFGACTERDGHMLNAGLVEYKESFGARTVVHDIYTWDLTTPAVTSP